MTFTDPYPGGPRVLFLGMAQSSHTRAWIEMAHAAGINARLFAIEDHLPPDDWPIPTYVPWVVERPLNPVTRYAPSRRMLRVRWHLRRIRTSYVFDLLKSILEEWQPQAVHTLGMDPAAYFFLAYDQYYPGRLTPWVVQVRGNPDLTVNWLFEGHRPLIAEVLERCDFLLADNHQNYAHAIEMGLDPAKRFLDGTILPGSGGVNVAALAERGAPPPSARERLVIAPKAYEGIWSKTTPVLEAIMQVWDAIQPCQFHLLTVGQEEMQIHLRLLPAHIRDCLHLYPNKIDRETVLDLMCRARVMLAPSLFDGVPNVLYEAMAAGAVPIVSPLATITPVIDETHALFARNLYPDEIAAALVKALNDDATADHMAQINQEKVRQIAGHEHVQATVRRFYEGLTPR